MKLPLWAKDKEGKWKVFPHEGLKTYANGRVGLEGNVILATWTKFAPFQHLFEYSINEDRVILKEDIPPGDIIWL